MKYVFIEPDTRVHTWRTDWPANEMARRGYDVVRWTAHEKARSAPRGSDVTYVLHFINKGWQVQETGKLYSIVDLALRLREHGRLIITVDDDWTRMLEIQPRPIHPAARILHGNVPGLMRSASRVVVATPYLAEVFGRFNEVRVAPNAVPEWVLGMAHRAPLERIAWMGEMYIHGAHDWHPLEPYAADLPPLHLIGPHERDADILRSWGAPDITTTHGPVVNQRLLYREIGRPVGAVIPISDTPFNRGKSWSKPMEFLARGVPVVAGWHAEYERLDDLTGGAVPTFDSPGALVAAANDLWEHRRDGTHLPDRLRDAGLTMETGGGDAWEKALL